MSVLLHFKLWPSSPDLTPTCLLAIVDAVFPFTIVVEHAVVLPKVDHLEKPSSREYTFHATASRLSSIKKIVSFAMGALVHVLPRFVFVPRFGQEVPVHHLNRSAIDIPRSLLFLELIKEPPHEKLLPIRQPNCVGPIFNHNSSSCNVTY